MKGVQHMWVSGGTIFQALRNSPILRICTIAAALSVTTGCNKLGLGDASPTAPSGPPAAGSTIFYTAVGASDANGVGSSAVCVPFDLTGCPNGMGYVPVSVRTLKAQGFTVTNLNLGIPTAVIGRDFQTPDHPFNFIESEMPFIQQNATVVTIFAGINEVNTITAALGGGAGASNPNQADTS